jgi:hypothetical protein
MRVTSLQFTVSDEMLFRLGVRESAISAATGRVQGCGSITASIRSLAENAVGCCCWAFRLQEEIASKYLEMRTNLTDERYLVEALRELGYEPEVCRESKALIGYMGDERAERAQIIIRRLQLDSASNDIGFARDGNGVYRAIISKYDRGIGFDDAWIGRVSQVYKEHQTMAVAKAKGYIFKGREVINTPQGKKVQLRFAVR